MGATYRRLISVDPTKTGSNAQANIPVYVHFSDPTIKSVANSGHVNSGVGNDITFYTTPYQIPSTLLNWELENYDQVNGILDAWIKIPSLGVTSATRTNIWMFYGDASISSFQGGAVGSAWSGFQGVWHWGLNGALSMADSSGNTNTGTNTGTATFATGIADGGVALASASSQYIDFGGTPANLQLNYPLSVECWFNTSTAANQVLITSQANSSATNWFIRVDSTGAVRYTSSGAGGWVSLSATGLANGSWHHAAIVLDGSRYFCYIDGAYIPPTANAGVGTGFIGAGGGMIYTGFNQRFGARGLTVPDTFFNGTLDEIRISNVARSADYITAVFNMINSNSTFLSVGSEQTVVPASATILEADGNNQFYQRGSSIRHSLYNYNLGG